MPPGTGSAGSTPRATSRRCRATTAGSGWPAACRAAACCGSSAAANEIVAAEEHEIDLYERFSDFSGYGFYVAARTDE